MAKITYTTKEDRRTVDVPEVNRVTAANMNEIKASVNALYDRLEAALVPVSFAITSADFAGDTYQNALLVGKTAVTGFNVFTNDGSGVLLKFNDCYTFNSGTGTLTMSAGNYRIEVYKALP
jgi:hypothetical protein